MPDDPTFMTPEEFKAARIELDLDRGQFGFALGYSGMHANDQVFQMEKGRKPIRPAQVRLVRAYLSGYRCSDWGDNGLGSDAGEVEAGKVATFDGE